MILTRANVESELVSRYGALLTLVGKATTQAGANADLNGPIREGLLSLGHFPAAFTVADDDLSAVVDAEQAQLMDVAGLRVLLNVQAAYIEVDQQVDSDSQKLGQIGDRLAKQIADLRAHLTSAYGVGLSTLAVGTFARDFAEEDDDGDEFA